MISLMRNLGTLLLVAFVASCRGPANAPDGVHVGGEIHASERVRFALVEADPDKFAGETVLVEGTVLAVCQKRGCWMQISDGGARTAMARWEKGCGGQFTFPMDSVGKRVLVQGSIYRRQFSEADIEHMQGEAGRDISIERDALELSTTAVVVLDERG